MEGNCDLHINVPTKYKQIAFEQGIPLAAMVLRALTKQYEGKLPNSELIPAIGKQARALQVELEVENPDREVMKGRIALIQDLARSAVI